MATDFNVPVALSNMAPFGECGRRTKDVFILKKLFDIHRQKYVPFREIEQLEQNPISGKLLDEERRTNWKKRVNGLFYSRLSRQQIVELEDKGLSFHENTPEEILGLVREMNERIDGKFVIPDDYKDLQRMHLQIFPEEHPLRSSPPGSPIAYDFMKRNIQLWK
ncbi:MAG: hypothetical protein GY729_21740 [Desulfobacteraceae bacterium]|nr:hypothetical protein [Desulfobacteraceae bacterium]